MKIAINSGQTHKTNVKHSKNIRKNKLKKKYKIEGN